jgi:hypothetical protein
MNLEMQLTLYTLGLLATFFTMMYRAYINDTIKLEIMGLIIGLSFIWPIWWSIVLLNAAWDSFWTLLGGSNHA